MSDNKKFNFKLFARLLNYVLPYKINFAFLSVAAILISVFLYKHIEKRFYNN